MSPIDAIVLSGGMLGNVHGKVTHGLLRDGTRFRVVAVVDPLHAGRDAGEVLDGRPRGVPVFGTLAEARAHAPAVRCCVVGLATHGGRFTDALRADLLEAVQHGLSVVNGLHDPAAGDPAIAAAARESGVELIDVRHRPPPLRFWDGSIREVRAPRVAVIGTDCALGKRTTCRLLLGACNAAGLRTEMIFTGQTGWMQGGEYGFVLDSVKNDFVSGALEGEIVRCDRERSPELILLEGQSALRNPSGPCGAELLVSAGARGVVLQHAPGRRYFEGYEELEAVIPPLAEELELIRLYGSRVLAITLNGEGRTAKELERDQEELRTRFGLPVVRPLEEGVAELVPVLRAFARGARR